MFIHEKLWKENRKNNQERNNLEIRQSKKKNNQCVKKVQKTFIKKYINIKMTSLGNYGNLHVETQFNLKMLFLKSITGLNIVIINIYIL